MSRVWRAPNIGQTRVFIIYGAMLHLELYGVCKRYVCENSDEANGTYAIIERLVSELLRLPQGPKASSLSTG